MNQDSQDPSRPATGHRDGLLDPELRPALERHTRLAARALATPVALINAVDERSPLRAAAHAAAWPAGREEAIAESFCRRVVANGRVVRVPDSRDDPEAAAFAVDAGIVAYLGVPIVIDAGTVLGTLCVACFEPRAWTDEDERTLLDLAAGVVTERELHRAHERFDRIIKHLPAILWTTDTELRFTFFRGVVPGWDDPWDNPVLGRTVQEVVAGLPDGARAVEGHRSVLHGEPVGYDFRVEGRTYAVHLEPLRAPGGALEGVAGVGVDITERTEMVEALRRSEERFRLATLAANDLIYDYDIRSGEIVWSDAIQARFLHPQRPSSDIEWWKEQLHPEERDRVVADLERAIGADDGSWTQEYRFRRGDGSYARILERGYIVRDPEGSAIRMIGTMADITEQKRAEETLRLASLGTLIGGVAHELNNPLTTIKSFSQLMLLDEHPEEAREALEIMHREADRAAKIVSDLRMLTRGTQEPVSDAQEVDVNEVVEHVLRVREYTQRTHNVTVYTHLARPLPPVTGDGAQLEQVLLNLVLNAEQAMADQPDGRVLSVRTAYAAGRVTISVADAGPGIAPEHRERIFDPFFTTKDPGEGTGLGLALVHSIVTKHGGRVLVESELGRGTEFRVELPVASPAAASAGSAPPPPAHRPTPIRLLVVDDEAHIRSALSRYLRRRGHQVEEAADGNEALVRLSQASFDVILSDLRMPGLGGEQLFERLQERGVDGSLVLMTGDAAAVGTAEALRRLAVPVLLKPFDLEEVAELLERHALRER